MKKKSTKTCFFAIESPFLPRYPHDLFRCEHASQRFTFLRMKNLSHKAIFFKEIVGRYRII